MTTINKTNTENALVVFPNMVNALANKDLKENVIAMLTASRDMEKNIWTYAIAVHNIVVNKYYEDDYKNVEELAKALGSTKSAFSKYVSAVTFIGGKQAEKYGLTVESLSYGKAYLLATLKEDFTAFMKANKKPDIAKMSVRALEEMIRAWKNKDVVNEEPTEEPTEETEETEIAVEAPKNTITAIVEDGLIKFTYRKKEYAIPTKELKMFLVKEEKAE